MMMLHVCAAHGVDMRQPPSSLTRGVRFVSSSPVTSITERRFNFRGVDARKEELSLV